MNLCPVKNIMTTDFIETSNDVNCYDLADILIDDNQELVPVIDQERRVLGFITDLELFDWYHTQYKHEFMEMTINNFMNNEPIFIEESSDLKAAARMMEYYNIPALPVVKSGRLTGLITHKNLLGALTKSIANSPENTK